MEAIALPAAEEGLGTELAGLTVMHPMLDASLEQLHSLWLEEAGDGHVSSATPREGAPDYLSRNLMFTEKYLEWTIVFSWRLTVKACAILSARQSRCKQASCLDVFGGTWAQNGS